ncbi:MAG: sarcosine oxidase subunit gamma family protein [Paracoccaceae bacterium]
MTDLVAEHAVALRTTDIGRASLTAFDPGPVFSIAPYPGVRPVVNAMPFPTPGQIVTQGAVRLVWAGREQAFLIGAAPDEGLSAAITDQSDGWAWFRLQGEDATAVLARLTPLDLRVSAFAPGTSARAPLNHMQAVILRTAADAFELAVFRSMAQTAQHELVEAMTRVAARRAR